MPASAEGPRRSFVGAMWETEYFPRPRLTRTEAKERRALREQIVDKMNSLLALHGRPISTDREGCTMTAVGWTPVQIEGFSCELWLWQRIESMEGIPFRGLEYDLLVRINERSGAPSLLHLVRQPSIQPISWSVTGQFGRRAELPEYQHALVALDALEKAKHPQAPAA